MPINATLLISVGELSVRKNHKVVVEALQSLPDDYWYVIVGKGDLKDELEKMDHTGRLKLLGFRTDIKELLWCSDLFVFPSLQEGLPVALMEAMAAGLPVVASDIRGNRDLTENLVGGNTPWSQELQHEHNNSQLDERFWKANIEIQMKAIYGE